MGLESNNPSDQAWSGKKGRLLLSSIHRPGGVELPHSAPQVIASLLSTLPSERAGDREMDLGASSLANRFQCIFPRWYPRFSHLRQTGLRSRSRAANFPGSRSRLNAITSVPAPQVPGNQMTNPHSVLQNQLSYSFYAMGLEL